MKKIYFLFAIALMSSLMAFAQNSGKGFNYQAIARDINGQVLQNETVELRFSLIPGQYAPPTWEETQEVNTDVFGAFSLTVGKGVSTGGGTVNTYDELNYSAADFWLKVELKDGSEFFEISFRELMTVPYAEVARNAVSNPTGTILPFAGPVDKIPEGYLLCDGSLLGINDYPALFAVIGSAWGGEIGLSFNLPDCRGMFLRGVDNGAGNDPDAAGRTTTNTGGNTADNVGSAQADATALPNNNFTGETNVSGEHTHTVTLQTDNWFSSFNGNSTALDDDASGSNGTKAYPTSGEGDHSHDINIIAGGDAESRPKNVYVNYIIKY